MAKSKDMQAAIEWFKGQFADPINAAVEREPFDLDFLTAIAIQESYEVWGRAYKIKTPSEVLRLCVGDILDASGGRNPHAFPQSRVVLERAPRGTEMFKIARQALEDMAEVASTKSTSRTKLNFVTLLEYFSMTFRHSLTIKIISLIGSGVIFRSV